MARTTKQQIIDERREIEKYTVALLKKVKSDFTFKDVTDAIYNEKERGDLTKMIAMFDTGEGDELSNILDILTDAWNYFPHKALGGKSPEEML
jgi:translation elongation factor EF-1alpha